ncbi:MAG: phosphoribosylformylglycinamidine cyclo-ligase [Peptococcaceae bacterium]|jgi:phosphoribosylformylglycinamidine cyclo-ligase|nr:phosphoribosylformylglycinamidine cyclo-ligase [Peptococcaceae bacterium]
MGDSYRSAGVDIEAGERAVELMKSSVARTARPEVLKGLGGFGGLFQLDVAKYSEPVLVSGTDGVGTKLRFAFMMDRHDTVGQDAVAMCVNDVLTQGAEPLFFLDYLALGKLIPEKVATIVNGVVAGCELAGCALIGGETAEMPSFYGEGEYDLAGFAVGIVERQNLIDGSKIREGDVLLGLPSTGLHSNGFSLVRKVFDPYELDTVFEELGEPLGNVLLRPTRIYVKTLLPCLQDNKVLGIAHITGGGLTGNVPRLLPEGLGVSIALSSWERLPIFSLIQRLGDIAEEEMYRTFNMGIGIVLIVRPEDEELIRQRIFNQGEKCWTIGSVIAGGGVNYK